MEEQVPANASHSVSPGGMSHVTRHTSHVTRHTLHVTRHTSHVTRHTLHITPHTAHIVLSHVALGAVEHELVAPDVRQSGIQRGFSHVPLHWNSPHAGKRRPVATRRA